MLLTLFYSRSLAQDDLMSALEEEDREEVVYVNNTFKGTRLINGHSVEVRDRGVLEFLISHRFGRLNSGAYELFGLDQSNIRLGLDYHVTGRLTVGLGRSSFEKVYDGLVKYQLLRQSTGKRVFPFTLTAYGNASVRTLRSPDPDRKFSFEQKLAYASQLLIARKFNERLSLQLMPSVLHRNYTAVPGDDNTIFAIGIGGRYKISNRIALSGEYYYRLNGYQVDERFNSLAIGVDIETGGHVFQLMFTNSRQMVERGFIAETDGSWGNGDIHFGFNITRVFFLTSSSNKNETDW